MNTYCNCIHTASGFYYNTVTSLFADPPDLNPDGASHQKPYQHKPRRGRPRHNNDRNLSSNSYDPSQQYGHFHQGFKPPFSHDNSNYALRQHPPYHEEDGARRRGRGRGRREGNGDFGGSSSWWQRPGGDFGNNRGASAYRSGAPLMDGPDGPNWRREDSGRNLEQSSEDQDARAKKPRRFSQEQRRRHQNERGNHSKENNPTAGGQRANDTKVETQTSDISDRTQRSRTVPDFQHDDHQRKHTEAKRRTGPIKPPKQPAQDETGSERRSSVQDDSAHYRSSQDLAASKAGRGSGRNTPLQARGGRRTHHQNHRPAQRNWDKIPESKETQTG